jgi:endonuclease I
MNIINEANRIVCNEEKYEGKCKYAIIQMRDLWCDRIAETFSKPEDKRKIMIKVDRDLEGYVLLCAYENGEVLEDYICQEEVEDCANDTEYNEYVGDEEMALLACVGWRVDSFRNNDYYADWLEDEEDE